MPEMESQAQWVTAELSSVRMTEEHLEVPDGNTAQTAENALLTAKVSIGHAIGASSSKNPETFVVRLEFAVILYPAGSTEKDYLIDYKSNWISEFNHVECANSIDWPDAPLKAIRPYVAFTHHLAKHRAEEALALAGYRGPSLPSTPLMAGQLGSAPTIESS